MKTRIIDEAALSAIQPLMLKAYVRFENWVPSERYGAHSQVYVKGNDEIIVPGTHALGDYENVVADIINILSRKEGRDEVQIYRDIATSDRDVIRVRLPQAEADGSVSVSTGVGLVSNARDIVLSAACSAWDPRPAYRAGRIKQADEYMSRVRLGQTEQGSFIATLLAPVPPSLDAQAAFWPIERNEPFDRLVTRRLASGLDAAADAIEAQSFGADFGLFIDAVGRGLSANMCDAAAHLSTQEEGFEISVTWARTRPTPQARWQRSFTRSDGEMLQEAARIFQDRQPRPDEKVLGVITQLTRIDGRFNGNVVIKAFIDEKFSSVRAELVPDDYHTAIYAHDTNQPVSMRGTLERVGSRWRLKDPVNIEVVVDDEPDSET